MAPTLRRRLAWAIGLGMLVLLGLAGVFIGHRIGTHVTDSFDAALVTQARALAALIEQEGGRIEFDYTPEAFPEYTRDEDPHYFEIVLDANRPSFRSKHLTVSLPRNDRSTSAPLLRDAKLPDGRCGRVVQLTFTPKHSQPEPGDDGEDSPLQADAASVPDVVLLVARERESLNDLVAGMLRTLGAVGLGVFALMSLLLWQALVHGLKPLDDVVDQVRTVDADTLNRRVSVESAPKEIVPIVEQINALLTRLEDAMARERRFTGNVAHELRTPIAELRTLASVATRWPRDQLSIKRFFDDVQKIATGMETVIADLLLLARCDAGIERATAQPVHLADAIATAWDRAVTSLRREWGSEGALLQLYVDQNLWIEADESKLAIMLLNLFDNALSYRTANAPVHCAARGEGASVVIEISNACEAMTAQDIARAPEPFWRLDEARAVGDHAGLGLSLVTALAQLLRWRVSIDLNEDAQFRVSIHDIAVAAPCSESATTTKRPPSTVAVSASPIPANRKRGLS